MRLVRDESMAEDLVSEVFLEAWRSSGRFEAKSQVLTWLISIARNKALTELRRRPKIAADERVVTSIEDDADGPVLALDKRDRSEIIHDCVGRLSPQHQEIIDLVYYQEKKLHEVAASLGAPINTVKTRIFYARNRMAQLLAEAGVDRTWAAI
jgi:RNA polymerase sigma-70 factor (ECF subfamily)